MMQKNMPLAEEMTALSCTSMITSSKQSGATQMKTSQVSSRSARLAGHNGQFSSLLLFASLVLFLNLCPPFQLDFDQPRTQQWPQARQLLAPSNQRACLSYFESGLQFVRLIFTNPMRLEARASRFSLAEARMLGKMAKVWYIKKKIKKLSKKLKKHTIAVPVFTAIPIYEHSY